MDHGNIHRSTIHCKASTPSLSEVEQARPHHGQGAPSRNRSHYDRILTLLRERGPAGVLSSELYDAPYLYGRSPRNRISELRKDGHLIQTVPAGASVVRYVLTHENLSPVERPPARPQPLKSWEQIVKERDEKMRQPEPVFELRP